MLIEETPDFCLCAQGGAWLGSIESVLEFAAYGPLIRALFVDWQSLVLGCLYFRLLGLSYSPLQKREERENGSPTPIDYCAPCWKH